MLLVEALMLRNNLVYVDPAFVSLSVEEMGDIIGVHNREIGILFINSVSLLVGYLHQ